MSPHAAHDDVQSFDLPLLCRFFSERSPQSLVALQGPNHIIRYANPAFASLANKSTAELLGQPFVDIVPPREGADFAPHLDGVFASGKSTNLTEFEYRQNPSVYWSFALWPIVGVEEKPIGVMIQVTDTSETAIFRQQARAINEALVISSIRQHELIDSIEASEQERHEIEAQVFEAQKLESLGVLASGIAHDLNNMLTPVLGYAELAAAILPPGSPAAPMLEEVSKNTRRAADLLKQILAYAGKGRFILQRIDLSNLVHEMRNLLSSAISIHAKLEYELTPDLPPMEADKTQLLQVVLNLVTNASESLGEAGGKIVVRTGLSNAQKPQPSPGGKGDAAGTPSVYLEVTDSGCGISPDLLAKIFDPFFSTKFTGRGLGLAVVQGIVRGHDGTLAVQSKPGSGSTFRLTLPCSTPTILPAPAPPPVADWRGVGTILVIDDELMVRGLVAHILKLAGLTVVTAQDGQHGLMAFREHSEIDAVVLDLTMPNISGLEVAEELKRLRPNLPIVLMSGFSVSDVTRRSEGLAIAGFIQKPFGSAEFLAVVRNALGQ